MGKRQGYKDKQSGLFREILRIVDEHTSIRVLFLEKGLHRANSLELDRCSLKRLYQKAKVYRRYALHA